MSEKNSTKHVVIPKQLLIAQRERSSVWKCRYCIDNRWQRTSTGERDIAKAKLKAHELLMEANVRKRMNVAPITRYFNDVAQHAIKRMKNKLAGRPIDTAINQMIESMANCETKLAMIVFDQSRSSDGLKNMVTLKC